MRALVLIVANIALLAGLGVETAVLCNVSLPFSVFAAVLTLLTWTGSLLSALWALSASMNRPDESISLVPRIMLAALLIFSVGILSAMFPVSGFSLSMPREDLVFVSVVMSIGVVASLLIVRLAIPIHAAPIALKQSQKKF